ncbi:MAG TPA: nucleoside-diphosphate kinase [Terrimicrobiaceae bacterium]|nr:nucleoside-diphosphate kinase [Terrimicrobiaceae bacterium]
MAEEISYVLVTPYSIRKSRTGGILSRLLSRSGLELVAGRMFAPGQDLVEEFAAATVTETDERHRRTQELIRDYVLKKFSPDAEGRRQRVLLLILKGEDAVLKTRTVAGHIVNERTSGETIRDTYGDYVVENGEVVYFEPGVLAAPDSEAARKHLAIWAKYSDSDGGILDETIPFPAGANIEKTLVLIKPDNFRFPNARAGGVMDLFSRTGLSIIGFKVHHMSVAQAEAFYRPVLDVLMDKLREPSSKRARLAVEEEFGIPIDDATEKQLGELMGPIAGRNHWESIVQFMAGTRPNQCPAEKRDLPGSEKCVALIYQGVDAVRKIREVLGPTDPSKAPFGTIRREFGQSVMVNAAHASDAPENAKREMDIIRATENNLKPLINSHLS